MHSNYFFNFDGQPRPVCETLRNPELAVVLRKITAKGTKGLFEDTVAQAIVDKVNHHPTNPMPDQPEYGTSYISIVDGAGNAIAMTTTIEDQFGARRMVTTDAGRSGGFLPRPKRWSAC